MAFGDSSRWLINKSRCGNGWLLHEPVIDGALPATTCPSFDAACQLFAAFTRTLAHHG